MEKKCILLVRVSTQHQDLDQQREKVFEAAKADGYKDSEIIVIEDKESAIKLSEEERHGLTELKNYIESDPSIDRVYTYELSRISRQAQMLYKIRDLLVAKGVNLIVLNPYFQTLKDGKLDPNSNIFFGFFTANAENEGFLSKARQRRGKLKKLEQGKFTGGKVLYGYRVNKAKGNLIEPDPETAKIVKEIFEYYSTGKHSIGTVIREFGKTRNQISDILNNCMYCGRPGKEKTRKTNVSEIVLPAIISEELFDLCKKIREENPRKLKKKGENIYYAKGIMYCAKCRRHYSANLTTCAYRCSTHGATLPINVVDSLLWELAKNNRKNKLKLGYVYDEEVKRLQDSYPVLHDKLAKVEQDLEKIKGKKDKLGVLYLNDSISEEVFQKKDKEIKKEHKDLLSEKQRILDSINDVTKRIDNITTEKTESPLDLDLIEDDAERVRIIREEIYSIVVMDKPFNSTTAKVGVSFNAIVPELEDSRIEIYNINTKNYEITNENGKRITYTFLKRFTRTEKVKASMKKACKKYQSKTAEKVPGLTE